jgi:negative regulator of flagellin synthesis FlgM
MGMEIRSNWDKLEPYVNRADFDKTRRHEAGGATSPANSESGDKVSLSTSALKDLVMREAVAAPDIRQEKVNALKAQISSGQYAADARDIAGKLLGGAF